MFCKREDFGNKGHVEEMETTNSVLVSLFMCSRGGRWEGGGGGGGRGTPSGHATVHPPSSLELSCTTTDMGSMVRQEWIPVPTDVRPTGDQEVAGSTPPRLATFFRGD